MSLQYVIDGYNITHHPEFSNNIPKSNNDSRLALVYLIHKKKLCGSQNNKVWVVFDGFPDQSNLDLNCANIEVVFSRRESADDRIKKIIEKSSNPKCLVVVSDDKEIIFYAKGFNARVLSVRAFIQAGSCSDRKSVV